MIEIRNAVVDRVSVTIERGFLTMDLYLNFGDGGQAFGGYVLHVDDLDVSQANFCGLFLYRCMRVAGVDKLNDITGKAIRVLGARDGKIEAIGHIIKEDWFNPTFEFDKIRGKHE